MSEDLPKCPQGLQAVQWKVKYQFSPWSIEYLWDYSWTYPLKRFWFDPPRTHISKWWGLQPFLPGINWHKDLGGKLCNGVKVPASLCVYVSGPGFWHRLWEPKWWFIHLKQPGMYVGITLDWDVVTRKTDSTVSTVKLYAGYTHQPTTKAVDNKWNVATWGVCYKGPLETKTAILPGRKWEAEIMPWWEFEKITIEKCEPGEKCAVDLQPLSDAIGSASALLAEIPVPEDHRELHGEITRGMERTRAELSEAGSHVKRSNEADSEKNRLELRAAAIDHLLKARDLKSEVTELLSQLEEALGELATRPMLRSGKRLYGETGKP